MQKSVRKNKSIVLLRLWVLLSFGVTLLQSCNPSNEKAPKNINELIPEAKRDYSENTQNKEKTANDTLKTGFLPLFKAFSDGHKFSVLKQSFYIDRFGPKESWKIQISQDSTSSTLSCWTFSDSIKTQNAFYNWLDCFGAKCKSLKVGEHTRIDENSGEIWLKDTLFVYWSSTEGEISERQRDVIKNFMPDTLKYHLKWKKGAYTRWIGL